MAFKTEPSDPPTAKQVIEAFKLEEEDVDTKQIPSAESSPSKKRKLISNAERWTDAQSKLLMTLREAGHSFQYPTSPNPPISLTREIVDMGAFPGRTKKALQLQFSSKKRELTEIFSAETVRNSKGNYLTSRMRRSERNMKNTRKMFGIILGVRLG
jgi:hypothetical protein